MSEATRIKPGDRVVVDDTGQTGIAVELTRYGWVVSLSEDPEQVFRTYATWEFSVINPHMPGEDSDLDERAKRCWDEIVEPMIDRAFEGRHE